MKNALFTYRRKVQSEAGEDVINDNFLNPLQVTSFFWSVNKENNKVLSVFLSNNYNIVFGESTGVRFVNHMEDFLRFSLGFTPSGERAPNARGANSTNRTRTARNPIPADIVEEADEVQAAEWVEPTR